MLLCVFIFYSIHNAVISVFQRKDLGENELYTLNEGVRLAVRLFVFNLSVCLTFSLTFTPLHSECYARAGLYFRRGLNYSVFFFFLLISRLLSCCIVGFGEPPLLPYKHNCSVLNLVFIETLTHVQ